LLLMMELWWLKLEVMASPILSFKHLEVIIDLLNFMMVITGKVDCFKANLWLVETFLEFHKVQNLNLFLLRVMKALNPFQ